VRVLSLGASVLEYCQRMQVQQRLSSDHIDYHKDHLLFLVWQLLPKEAWKVKLIVDLEHVFVRRQSVNNVVFS